jgi:uncharacterized protein YndB with AHSA1/START domain
MHLFLVLLLALSAEGYERIGDKHDVVVYKRKGHAIDLAAEGEIDAPPAVVQRVLTDYASHPKWVHGLSVSRILVQNGSSLDVYQRLDLPLVGDRDFTLRVEWASEGDDLIIRFHGIDSGPPSPKGVVRIPLHEGSWTLQPLDGGTRTHAVYRFRMELGGHLPMWMARGRAGKDVPDLIEAIRNQVRYYR